MKSGVAWHDKRTCERYTKQNLIMIERDILFVWCFVSSKRNCNKRTFFILPCQLCHRVRVTTEKFIEKVLLSELQEKACHGRDRNEINGDKWNDNFQ